MKTKTTLFLCILSMQMSALVAAAEKPVLVPSENVQPAAEVADCKYAGLQGFEFKFEEKPQELQEYGYPLWSFSTDETVPRRFRYSDYVNMKGKFLFGESASGNGRAWYHEAILEDCRKAYMFSTESTITSKTLLAGIQSVSDDPYPERWQSNITTDKMTDQKSCAVYAESFDGSPIFIFSKGRMVVSVNNADFPGRPVLIRVDKNAAMTAQKYFTVAQSQALNQQIRKGKLIRTQYYQWPDDYAENDEFSVKLLPAALDKCAAEVRKP